MSGHSKWAKIKRAKGVTDQKRGALFTKLGNAITVAAKTGGGDADLNFALRLAIDKAKAANLPKDNVQKAIDKGLGVGKDAVSYENISYEGYLGGDIAFIIDCLTDNANRTYAEVRKMAESSGAVMGSVNSVSWQFEEMGRINMYLGKVVKSEKYGGIDKLVKVEGKDEVMLQILDIPGVNDVLDMELEFVSNDELEGEENYMGFEILTSKTDLNHVYKEISKLGYKIESAEVVKICKSPIEITEEKEEKLHNFIEKMEESDDVLNVWHNVK